LVIGGWHPGAAGRSGQLGSLQLGYYKHDSLHFAGHVVDPKPGPARPVLVAAAGGVLGEPGRRL
jgi:hypothetical protein